jgi:hypothetical protein
MKIHLSFGCGLQCVTRRVERSTESIAYDLENISIIRFYCSTQNGMMSRAQRFPSFMMFPRQLGAAFDVGE